MTLAPVCILAGGLGTRLGERVRDTPKPLIEVAGQPFLLHQLALLRAYGAQRVVLCVGYLGERIEERLGDAGALGLELRYRYDPPALAGTAGAVRAALDDLGERFLVLYGDTYLRIDYGAVEEASHGWPALMTVLRNDDRWDASNADYRDGRVLRYEKGADGHAAGSTTGSPCSRRRRWPAMRPTSRDVFARARRRGAPRGLSGDRALLRDRHAARRWPRPTRFSVEEAASAGSRSSRR